MKVGETKEALVVSHGFPGWWGMYPAVVSSDSSVAQISHKKKRSYIPLRKPGLILGGKVYYMTALKPGETHLMYGNLFQLQRALQTKNHDARVIEKRIKVVVIQDSTKPSQPATIDGDGEKK